VLSLWLVLKKINEILKRKKKGTLTLQLVNENRQS